MGMYGVTPENIDTECRQCLKPLLDVGRARKLCDDCKKENKREHDRKKAALGSKKDAEKIINPYFLNRHSNLKVAPKIYSND